MRLCLWCLLCGGLVSVQAATVTGGGLAVSLDDAGQVTDLVVDGQRLPVSPAPLVSLCDVTVGPTFVAGRPVTGGGLEFPGLDAAAELAFEPTEAALRVTCTLRGGAERPARGVLLRFTLPLDAVGWWWHDDLQTRRQITAGTTYETVEALRAWPDLPEWADQPNLRIGAASRNFCTVLTGPVGLCLAADIARPVIFRTAYDSAARQLQLVYDLALSPDTATPNAWTFAFELSACDPEWGFRDALARYYARHPGLFVNPVAEAGQWLAFTDLKEIDNPNEFEFGLQEGARDPAYDDQLGVLDCTYFTHAGQFVRIPDHDPERDPEPPFETILAETERTFERVTGLPGIFREVGLTDATGQFQIPKTRVYGHYIAQFNLDPDLRYGQWHLDRTAIQTEQFAAKGGRLDGFYYDGLTTGLNYRTDHFRTSLAPPLWDPIAGRPVLNNFFNSCEFARAAAELLRPRDQITMMNGALGATFFVAPWLDVFGAETGLRIPRAEFNYVRSIIGHKPMLTLLKGNFEQRLGAAEIELFMQRALAYGIFPGFFDWPPSGLGPGGRYWDHPAYYERDRALHRRYLPLVKTLHRAGWQPVTLARSDNPLVHVERFGPGPDGIVYLTLLNEQPQPQTVGLAVDLATAGLADQAGCLDLITGRGVDLTAPFEVPADGVMMLQVARPEQATGWRREQAVTTLARGAVQRRVDVAWERPALAVHWRADRGRYDRDGGRLALTGQPASDVSASQWAMLFQPEPEPLRLRVVATARELTGQPRVRCRLAWVTSSFSHYQEASLDLAPGSYEAREFVLPISSEQPLRAVFIQPLLPRGSAGLLRVESISLTDSAGREYVRDPSFADWYEPVPEGLRDRLEHDLAALAERLTDSQPATLVAALSRAGAIREWILAADAANGCRRALRDLETAEQHLTAALLTSLGAATTTLAGPPALALGDTADYHLPVAAVAGVELDWEYHASAGEVGRTETGAARLTAPATATPGSRLALTGHLTVRSGGHAARVGVTREVALVEPLAVTIERLSLDPVAGAVDIVATAHNRRNQPVELSLTARAPGNWQEPTPLVATAPPGSLGAELRLTARDGVPAGPVEVMVTVADTVTGQQVSAVRSVLYIPPEANLIREPSFEAAAWPGGEQDRTVSRSGGASLRLHNPQPASQQASQSVVLNQELPCPVLVSCYSRGEAVSGPADRGYSLYVDLYYTDGTPRYGIIFPFATGTTDWQRGELLIEPEKPIRTVNVYLLLRGKSGTVWFDDVAVAEDPRRRGNIARQATVEVDSRYAGYAPAPLTDGVVEVPAEAHWTAEAWASAESPTEHWIELRWDEPQRIRGAAVYWSRDGGDLKTSREVQLQVADGAGWRTVATARPTGAEPRTAIALPAVETTARVRLLQPGGGGSLARPNLMWVRELEVYRAD